MGSHQQSTMGEGSKQVRVDNWGIFFLQRLQMFFNKTDYCDLTLQFEGNVQLKVHRLVMNACTEYFRILERNCEIADDVLIMPPDLQADVVLPIVNFMYTGMLEFHMSIYDKLYKTANLMNITVLTKLLDAQKTPIAPLTKPINKKNMQIPHTWNLQGKKITAKTVDPDLPAPLPGRKLPVWKRKSVPAALPHTVLPHFYPEPKRNSSVDPLAIFDNAPKPTRFEWPDEDMSTLNVFDSSFNDISYTSKPLFTKEDEPKPSTSFDRIKETANSSRKSTTYETSFVDIDDVKDYVNEQRIRSHMNDDNEEDVDDDFDGDKNQSSLKRKLSLEQTSNKRVRFNLNEKENQKTTKINILPTGKLSADVDHTKIISEVLKKYPNLVKKNKNIRLKILAKSDNPPTSVTLESTTKSKKFPPTIQTQQIKSQNKKAEEEGTWTCEKCSTRGEQVEFVLYYLYRKHMTDVHSEKFDSQMCKFCGHKSSKHNMLMYHLYVKHGIKPPLAYNFPKCMLCQYVALSEAHLVRHQLNHAKFILQCVECDAVFSNERLLNEHMLLTGHSGNTGKNNFDCQYCCKKFQSALTLFTHLKTRHKDEARKDGIISLDEGDIEDDIDDDDDDDDDEYENEEGTTEFSDNNEFISQDIKQDRKDKIKILSDVKLSSMEVPQTSSDSDRHNLSLEPSSEAEALNNVASGIATSLGLVDVVVLDENQQYILHTDSQQSISTNESEFILPDLQDTRTFTTTQQVIASEQNVIAQPMLHNSDIASTDELVMVLTDHDYGDGNNEIINGDNANIVVLYSHPIQGQESQFLTSEGNIVLTSQAGLIELRNTNAVVTSTTSHFIGNSNAATNNTAIESIEMIQREIDEHPGMQEVKPAEDQLDSNSATRTSTPVEITEEVLSQTEKKAEDQDFKAEEKEEEDNIEIDGNTEKIEKNEETSESQGETADTKEDITIPNEGQVNNDKHVEEPDEDNVSSVVIDDESKGKEELGKTDDVPETNGNVSNEENKPELPQHDEIKKINLNSEQVLEDASTTNEEQISDESQPISESTEEPKNETRKTEENTDCNNEEVHEHVDENKLNESLQDEVCRKSQVDENEKCSDNLPREGSDKSARIILEDWEDTDSQQSDPKSSANVHKLIDDWDDDEDDKKS